MSMVKQWNKAVQEAPGQEQQLPPGVAVEVLVDLHGCPCTEKHEEEIGHPHDHQVGLGKSSLWIPFYFCPVFC